MIVATLISIFEAATRGFFHVRNRRHIIKSVLWGAGIGAFLAVFVNGGNGP